MTTMPPTPLPPIEHHKIKKGMTVEATDAWGGKVTGIVIKIERETAEDYPSILVAPNFVAGKVLRDWRMVYGPTKAGSPRGWAMWIDNTNSTPKNVQLRVLDMDPTQAALVEELGGGDDIEDWILTVMRP